MGKPRLIIAGPEPAKELLSASDKDYNRPPVGHFGPFARVSLCLIPFPTQILIANVMRLFGKSIVTRVGEDWQRQHRLLYKVAVLLSPYRIFWLRFSWWLGRPFPLKIFAILSRL